jgi:hypothetical protein
MIGRFLSQVVVSGGGSRRHRIVTQVRRQTPAFRVGQRFQNTLRLRLRRQDAFQGAQGVGAEADGAFQGGQ